MEEGRDSAPGDASSCRVRRRRRSHRWLERDWSARRGHRVKRGIAVRSSEFGARFSRVRRGEVGRFRGARVLGRTVSKAGSSERRKARQDRPRTQLSRETACLSHAHVQLVQDTRYPLKILRLTLGALRRMTTMVDKEEARKRLTPLQWHVTQEKGTER